MANQRSFQEIRLAERGKKCPDCGSEDIECQGSELICKKCGFVIED